MEELFYPGPQFLVRMPNYMGTGMYGSRNIPQLCGAPVCAKDSGAAIFRSSGAVPRFVVGFRAYEDPV